MWDWIKEGSLFFPIYFPNNFEEYVQILWEHTSYTYCSLIFASILLFIITVTFVKQLKNEDSNPKNINEEIAENIDINDRNVISHIKKVQNRMIHRKIEENMSQDEVHKELEIQQQQLSQIYSLLKEHEEKFGDVSMEDIKGQMNSLYKE
ncbi:uncharacterized protein [Lepeophtheirus salmonis]|uniref:uncharacterized protein n=1 Tax=Lepeophtheirus salmonis TaxID=72036 RepID=UPI003AF35597